jgi:hypothetical protein
MLRLVAHVITNVSGELIGPIITVTRISELGTTSLATEAQIDSCHPDGGGDTLLQNVGSYESHTTEHPRRRHFLFSFFLASHYPSMFQ